MRKIDARTLLLLFLALALGWSVTARAQEEDEDAQNEEASDDSGEDAPPTRTRPRPTPRNTPQESPQEPARVPAPRSAAEAGLREFETGVEFEPVRPNARVTFNLEDADLPDLVRLISNMTGRRFILPGKARNIKASVFAPTQVTAREAYEAFLSILEVNGMTVVPSGRYLKIIDTAGAETQPLPVSSDGIVPVSDRFMTRLDRVENSSAEDAAYLLGRFKSNEGSVTAYAPTNTLIITDTGRQIRRMLDILDAIDVSQTGEQIWIEPVHYA